MNFSIEIKTKRYGVRKALSKYETIFPKSSEIKNMLPKFFKNSILIEKIIKIESKTTNIL